MGARSRQRGSGPRVLASNSRTNGGERDNLIKRLKHTVCFIIILATMFVAAAVQHRHLLFHIYILLFLRRSMLNLAAQAEVCVAGTAPPEMRACAAVTRRCVVHRVACTIHAVPCISKTRKLTTEPKEAAGLKMPGSSQKIRQPWEVYKHQNSLRLLV